ncbi:MAG: hypothetical protein HQL31_05725 [Planctomycetes bacterium]|nr:hypothetical protein [Planctomycetota bacterium]
MKKGIKSYRLSKIVEEFDCPCCGYPLYVGDMAVEYHGECFCSKVCALKSFEE